jgi:hypothetical protein
MHYKKDTSFTSSSTFHDLAEGMKFFNDWEEVEQEDKKDMGTLFWRYKIEKFLFESEDKWALEQYYLAK